MIEINNRTRSNIDLILVKKITDNFLRYYNIRDQEISIAFVGDKTIRQLNREYLDSDSVTDVLAFPGEGRFLGEIIIDYAQIKRQAGRYSKNTREELIFVLVHGLLHLLGYQDDTSRKKTEMDKLTREFLISGA